LSRHPEVFQVDVHVVIEESGRKLWTDAGIELLRSRRATENAAENDADFSANDLLESLLENDSTALAREYWRQLPGRVLHRIRQMRDNPTPQDREIVQTSLRAALNAGTTHLLLPTYQPMLLEGDEATD
jgi:hypothetical protein